MKNEIMQKAEIEIENILNNLQIALEDYYLCNHNAKIIHRMNGDYKKWKCNITIFPKS